MNKKPEIISPKVVESTQSPAEQSVSKSPKVVKSTKSPAEQSISEFLNSLDFPLDPALLLETTLDGEYSTDTISLNSVSAGIGDVDQSHNDGLDSFITQIDNIDLDSIEDINDGAEHDNKRQDYNISGVEVYLDQQHRLHRTHLLPKRSTTSFHSTTITTHRSTVADELYSSVVEGCFNDAEVGRKFEIICRQQYDILEDFPRLCTDPPQCTTPLFRPPILELE